MNGNCRKAGGDGVADSDLKSARFHGTVQPCEEWPVIIQQKQGTIWQAVNINFSGVTSIEGLRTVLAHVWTLRFMAEFTRV